jgi:cytochrome c553
MGATLAALLILPSAPQAADKDAGRRKAQSCQGCHGLDGYGKVPGAPHLAGQDEAYFIKTMADYKSGARKNEMMSVAIEQVKPEDYADLAAFYASLGPKRD